MIYLDNNATTRIAPEVLEEMLPYLTDLYGNPSSPHDFGEIVKSRIGKARAAIAGFLGAAPAEILFTSGATESNHLAILGALQIKPERRQIVTTAVEHPSLLLLFRQLEEKGYRVVYLPVDSSGALDMDLLGESVTEETALVSMMWANNETGVVFPVERAAVLAKGKGALFHTDATQVLGKVRINLKDDIRADLLSFSGHKIHAPKGIGGLFVRKGVKLPPLLLGHQERGRRGGTENVTGIVGLERACGLVASGLEGEMRRVSFLRERLEEETLRAIPLARINGSGQIRISNTTNIRFGVLSAEAILNRLNRAGMMASAGSACSAGGTEPSHVLTAMGLSREEAFASIRFSLSRYTTGEEIERIIEVLPGVIEELAMIGAGAASFTGSKAG